MRGPRLLLAVAIVSAFVFPMSGQTAVTLTVTPVTWNIIGLDSNKPTTGPKFFPVGARVCTSVGTSDGPKPSERNTTGHQPKRLPNIVLRGHARSGALGPVDEPLDGIISFDDALASAEREDPRPDAKTVQVILGSADPKPLHWDSDGDLFYAITWGGVCIPIYGPPGATHPPCYQGSWGTVIDAHTGAFIVGGG